MSEGKKKNKIAILFIIIITILILTILLCSGSVFYFSYKTKEEHKKVQELSMQNNNAMLEMTEKIEYGTEVTYEDLLVKLVNRDKVLEDSKIKLYINDKELSPSEKYTFSEVGTYKAKIAISKEYTYKVLKPISEIIENEKETDIIVEDTKFPVIDGITDKEITVGDSINVLEGITAKDEIDGDLEIVQEGEIDTSKAGEYVVKVKAKDKNENETVKEMKVTVKDKETEPQNTTTSTNKNSGSTSSKNSSSTSTGSSSKNNTSSNKGTSTNKNTNAGSSSSSSSGSVQSSNSGSSSSSTQSSNDASTKSGRLNIAKEEAKKIVSKITKSGMSDYDKANAICQYLFNNVSRQTDQSTEAYKTNFGNEAYAALVLKKAACSGFCKAVTLMCDAAGLKSQHINANQWTHQWNKVYINGEWIILDAQIRFIGWNKASNRIENMLLNNIHICI